MYLAREGLEKVGVVSSGYMLRWLPNPRSDGSIAPQFMTPSAEEQGGV